MGFVWAAAIAETVSPYMRAGTIVGVHGARNYSAPLICGAVRARGIKPPSVRNGPACWKGHLSQIAVVYTRWISCFSAVVLERPCCAVGKYNALEVPYRAAPLYIAGCTAALCEVCLYLDVGGAELYSVSSAAWPRIIDDSCRGDGQ